MTGITFSAFRHGAPISLESVIDILGSRGRSSVWHVSRIEVAPGKNAEPLHGVAKRAAALSGDDLIALGEGTQVIDGEFRAHEHDTEEPWVVVRAVDGSSWDVLCNDAGVLDDYRLAFPDAVPLP